MIAKYPIFIIVLLSTAQIVLGGKDNNLESVSDQKHSTKPSWLSAIGSFFVNPNHAGQDEVVPLLKTDRRSELFTNKNLFDFLRKIADTNFVSSRMPFSDFGESAVVFFRTVEAVILHEQYDNSMDDLLKEMLESFKLASFNFNSFIVPIGDHHFLAYRHLPENINTLKSKLASFFEKKHQLMKNKIIANFWSNVFFAGKQLHAVINTFRTVNNLYVDKTRFYFKAKENNTTLEQSNMNIQRMVYTLSTINEILEDTHEFSLPVSQLSFYGDYMICFSTVFELTIKMANYDILMIAYRMLNGFKALAGDTSRFVELSGNKNEDFSFDLELKTAIVNRLMKSQHFLSPVCQRSTEAVLCNTFIRYLNNLEKNIEIDALDWIDNQAHNYRFKNTAFPIALEDQILPKKLKSDLKSTYEKLSDIKSPIYSVAGSSLAVHMKTIFSSSLTIFKNYQQPASLIKTFLQLVSLTNDLFEHARKKQVPGLAGKRAMYYTYEKVKCDELNNLLDTYGNLFRNQVMFDRKHSLIVSQFYKVHRNIREAWMMYTNEMVNRRYTCEEKIIADDQSDSEDDKPPAKNFDALMNEEDDDEEFGPFISGPVAKLSVDDVERSNSLDNRIAKEYQQLEELKTQIDSEGNLIESEIYGYDGKMDVSLADNFHEIQEENLVAAKVARKVHANKKPFQLELNEVENDTETPEEELDDLLLEQKASRQQAKNSKSFQLTLNEVQQDNIPSEEEHDDYLLTKKAAAQKSNVAEPFKLKLNPVENDSGHLEDTLDEDLVQKKATRQQQNDPQTFKINLIPVENEQDQSSTSQVEIASGHKPSRPKRIIRKIILVESMNCGQCLDDRNLKSFVLGTRY
jgi:hypothetical protein